MTDGVITLSVTWEDLVVVHLVGVNLNVLAPAVFFLSNKLNESQVHVIFAVVTNTNSVTPLKIG